MEEGENSIWLVIQQMFEGKQRLSKRASLNFEVQSACHRRKERSKNHFKKQNLPYHRCRPNCVTENGRLHKPTKPSSVSAVWTWSYHWTPRSRSRSRWVGQRWRRWTESRSLWGRSVRSIWGIAGRWIWRDGCVSLWQKIGTRIKIKLTPYLNQLVPKWMHDIVTERTRIDRVVLVRDGVWWMCAGAKETNCYSHDNCRMWLFVASLKLAHPSFTN